MEAIFTEFLGEYITKEEKNLENNLVNPLN
jgi:hypothetical protein